MMSGTKLVGIVVVGLVALPQGALANWGGGGSGVAATGNFRATGSDKVGIEKEDLQIKLYRTSAVVKVAYEMCNHTQQEVVVEAGFPSLAANERGVVEDIVEYELLVDGLSEKYTVVRDRNLPAGLRQPLPKRSQYPEPVDGYMTPLRMSWLTSRVHFGAESCRQVEVKYRSPYLNYGGSGQGGIGWAGYRLPQAFRYLLSTGAVWQGAIKQGTVTVTQMFPNDEVAISVEPHDRFTRSDNQWAWTFENLEPSTADDLYLTTGQLETFGQHYLEKVESWDYEDVQRGDVSYRLDYRFAAIASSKPKAKRRNWPSANYVFGAGAKGDTTGLGESLTLLLDKEVLVSHVAIKTGVCQVAKYPSNGRATAVSIAVDDGTAIDATIPDEASDRYWFIPMPTPTKARSVRLTLTATQAGSRSPAAVICSIALRTPLGTDPAR